MPFPTGILGVAYNVAKDLVRAIFKKPDPEEIVRARKRWKDEIESNLRWIDDTVGFGELIIRDEEGRFLSQTRRPQRHLTVLPRGDARNLPSRPPGGPQD